MNQYNLLMTRSSGFTDMDVLLLGGVGLAVIIAIIGFVLISELIWHVVRAIPYYMMAKKAGGKNPWVAFVPCGPDYVAMMLPHREFSIFNKFKTRNRKKAFWMYIVTIAISVVLNMISEGLDMANQVLDTMYNEQGASIGILIGLLVLLVLMLMLLAFTLANTFASCMIRWRTYYDILNTYGMSEHAMWASVLSVFIPIVMLVFSYIIMGNEPEYGYGNYYAHDEVCIQE